MSTRACCDCEGCEDCFSTNAGNPCCRLNKKDTLVLKIERPSWTRQIAAQIQGGGTGGTCACVSNTRITGSVGYDEAHPLLVSYKHFVPDSTRADAGDTSLWFADNGSFGCRGGVDIEDLWLLWPPLCYQQEGSASSGNIAFCCDNNCDCSTTSTSRVNIGPSDDLVPGSVDDVCTNSNSANASNPNLTNVQVGAIEGTLSGRSIFQYTCQPGDGNPSASISDTSQCDYGDYSWLKGIYDDSANNALAQYRHFYYNPSGSGSVVEASGLHPLAHTIVCVMHREKWYKACDKVDGGTSDCDSVGTWTCRVPEYWAYGCAGIPIFSWELFKMEQAGKITAAEYKEFFKLQYENKPIGSTATGRSCLNKLSSSHWHSASDSAGFSILQTKDWSGMTLPGETSPVPFTETRLIRKDLARFSAGRGGYTQTVVANQLYDARPGGWTHICGNPPGACDVNCSSTLSGQDVKEQAPQVSRTLGCNGAATPCNSTTWVGQGVGGEVSIENTSKCFTASPFPQCGTCVNGTSCSGCSICDFSGCGGCDILSVACGDNVVECGQDTYKAACDNIHFTFAYNWHKQLPDGQEDCLLLNHAYLVVARAPCEYDTTDNACETDTCLDGPAYNTQNPTTNLISFNSSKQLNCGNQPRTDFCNSSVKSIRGGTLTNLTHICRGSTANRSVFADNACGSIQDKTIVTSDGCGRHLCNDTTNPVGACCVTETATGTVVCKDYMTATECASCGAVSGYSSVWKGKNSCCESNPC